MARVINNLKCGVVLVLGAILGLFVIMLFAYLIFFFTALIFLMLGWVNYPIGGGVAYTKISDILFFDVIVFTLISFIYWLDKKVG